MTSRGPARSVGRTARLRLTSFVVVLTTAGCYHYEVVPLAALQPGMEVRTRLSGDAVERARRNRDMPPGMLDGFTVRGQVARVSADSLQLTIPTSVSDGGYRSSVLTQDILLPNADVVGIEVHEVDKLKTGLLTAGVGIAAYFIVRQAQGGGQALGKPPGGGGPPENRVPIGFSIPLP
jgi:hypothetical protein